MNNVVGMSFERSPGTISKWIEFFKILGIDVKVSRLRPEEAVKKSDSVFKYSSDYCYFRRSCLGQYIDLIENGCNTIIVPVKIKDGYAVCNSSIFMASELSEYFPHIKIINVNMYTSNRKNEELLKVIKVFTQDEQTIERALSVWRESESHRKNAFLGYGLDDAPVVMLVGKINHFFDYTNINSPMVRFITNKLKARVIDPENISNRSLIHVRTAYNYYNQLGLQFKENKKMYWPEIYILASIIASKELIKGVIFVRDCYCNAGIEEINSLQIATQRFNIPCVTINFNLESQSTTETLLETFVEMIK